MLARQSKAKQNDGKLLAYRFTLHAVIAVHRGSLTQFLAVKGPSG